MDIWVDNVWSSPSTLHLRVCVLTGRGRRLIKSEHHLELADIAGLDWDGLSATTAVEIDPTRDVQQAPLF